MPHPAVADRPTARYLPARLIPDRWGVLTLSVALFVATPLIAVATIALTPAPEIWRHLYNTVLFGYVERTVMLIGGIGLGTFVIGTGTAWLVTMCRFPGRGLFNWALVLPLAVPTYILAFVFTDQLEYAGAVQGTLREVFGWRDRQDYWFPEIRSMGGAVTVMTLVLYPYVYLLARAAFLEQSVCVLEVSRTLGKTAWQSFWNVALPLARPAIVVGMTLAMMEALNDFGTVDFFGVKTFTAGIYDVWLNMDNISGAAQLASVLMIFVVVLVVMERMARRGQRYHHTSSKIQALPSYRLSGIKAALAAVFCAFPILLGFVLPASVLLSYAVVFFDVTLKANYLTITLNSISLSLGAAVIAVAIGLVLAYGLRMGSGPLPRAAVRFASIGYAVPGAVLAIGVIVPMAGLDNAIDAFSERTFGVSTGLLFSGTVIAILYGYLARFLALSFGTVEAGLGKVSRNMDGAARTLGASPFQTMSRVHFPLLRTSLLTAGLLVFVDCMKELPITIILRPFGYDTLATFVFQYASDELFEESALGALTIVAAGLIPVVILALTTLRSRPGHAGGGHP
ncbi:iron ABC transporter permease [Thalassospiraceae bacterium LMO-SO8]|nr:iron ABC transporter permease [Alphaproteobacteria bacterium LMO-S08]WND74996.1 iron ABC transporter permease [Thalassospiraceae bacterium LMO-SO8]